MFGGDAFGAQPFATQITSDSEVPAPGGGGSGRLMLMGIASLMLVLFVG